ncbi:MAG TPA: helix-turn-helix domain-containing protein [Burkholderiaceae bacterium]|nr:helix-turn-helix domain-containing protein [Burkholderiaceae bacterium]
MSPPHPSGRPGKPAGGGAIPRFALYGEALAAAPELLHIEDVHARSSLHQWEIAPHLHQGLYQVLWVRSGSVTAVLDERRQPLSGPVAIVVPPGVVHGFQFAPGTDGWVLTLNSRFLSEGDFQTVGAAFEAVFAAPRVLDMCGDTAGAARLDALMREVAAEFALAGAGQPPPTTAWLARALLWRLAQVQAALIPDPPARATAPRNAQFTRFLALVEGHYLSHWTVAQYAQRMGLSAPRLNRLVRAASGRTAQALVHERLTREACRRLLYVAAPATSLALELGFDDPAYFSRFFRRQTGLSPQKWREAQRKS